MGRYAPTALGIAAGVVACLVLRLAVGSTDILPLAEVWAGLTRTGSETAQAIVWEIRLPRAVACLLIGASLAAVGSSFQALFRNPLADPYIVGVGSGASVGVALVNVGGMETSVGGLASVGAAMVGGLASLGLVLTLARSRGGTSVNTLLLAGVVTGSLLASLTTLILTVGGLDANHVLRKLLGSMTPMFWNQVAILTVGLAITAPILYAQSRALNALAIGEDTARSLGVDADRVKALLLVTGTLLAAACVGVAGIIGFLGLAAPHLARLWAGSDWRRSMPWAMAIGAVVLTLADLVAARLGEVQVGVVTAILAAPGLLWMLGRQRT